MLIVCTPVKNGPTSLYVASQNGHLDAVKLLLEKNANIEASSMSDHSKGRFMSLLLGSDENGVTSLRIASQNGRLDIVKLLLDKDANIEASRTSNHARGCCVLDRKSVV